MAGNYVSFFFVLLFLNLINLNIYLQETNSGRNVLVTSTAGIFNRLFFSSFLQMA